MILKLSSLIAFGVAIIGLLFLVHHQHIISDNPVVIIIQISSFGLMIWARIIFGARSFHATANTTKGKLVTNGPYKYFRHPIYAAVIFLFSASLIAFPFKETVVGVFLIIAGLFVRLLLEEKSLNETYEEYESYSKRTKRLIPFIF
ncbi:isoprenylcysteine carboxylmethyltransferase family protein [Lutibacter sp.]|uniref:methyltransferase family protein n=1 Tax=Lutibacter sp. TaxID=1925666 RepID=UPI0035649A8E